MVEAAIIIMIGVVAVLAAVMAWRRFSEMDSGPRQRRRR